MYRWKRGRKDGEAGSDVGARGNHRGLELTSTFNPETRRSTEENPRFSARKEAESGEGDATTGLPRARACFIERVRWKDCNPVIKGSWYPIRAEGEEAGL